MNMKPNFVTPLALAASLLSGAIFLDGQPAVIPLHSAAVCKTQDARAPGHEERGIGATIGVADFQRTKRLRR